MSVSFCLPHPVAVSDFMICRGVCACTEMLCKLESTHPSKASVKLTKFFLVESVMRGNADSLLNRVG